MALPKIKIDPDGKSVHVDLQFSGPQMVLYDLDVWAKGSNDRLLEVRGNNDNPEDDHYILPAPASSNIGCKVVVLATVIDATKAPGKYQIDLVITQDGEEKGRVTAAAKMSKSLEDVCLIARLVS